MRNLLIIVFLISLTFSALAQNNNGAQKSFDEVLPVRGLSISVPAPEKQAQAH